MERFDDGEAGMRLVCGDVEGGADFDVLLGKVVAVDEHFADLVGVVGILAVVANAPAGHWQTTTLISSIRLDGSTACMAIEGATDTEVFRAYVQTVLCPTLRPRDVVILDHLSPHKK